MHARGPLYVHIPGLAASLASQGYSKTSLAYRSSLLRALDWWMQRRRMPLNDFSEERVEEFLHHRWRTYSKQSADRPTLLFLLRRLQDSRAVKSRIVHLRPVPSISCRPNLHNT